MKKIVSLLLVAFALCLHVQAQQGQKLSVNEELKKELMTKFSMTDDAAARVVVIEEEFYKAIAIAAAMPGGTVAEQKAKEKKNWEAHVNRREKLVALPLTGREMEDVITVSDRLHRTEKKA